MLPNFFLVGAPKAGTTSLYHYLDQHPQIYMSPIKEPCYFSEEIRPENFADEIRGPSTIDEYLAGPMTEKRFGGPVCRWEDYLRLFHRVRGEIAIGEASVVYLWSPTAARNIAAAAPHAKILIVLRDPVERARSQYADMAGRGVIHLSFDELVRAGLDYRGTKLTFEHPFLEFGRYDEQIARYRDCFPAAQIRIERYEAFRDDPLGTIGGVFGFLGVDPGFAPDLRRRHRVSRVPLPEMSPETRRALEDYYGLTPEARAASKTAPPSHPPSASSVPAPSASDSPRDSAGTPTPPARTGSASASVAATDSAPTSPATTP
jgi:hypothetical protein